MEDYNNSNSENHGFLLEMINPSTESSFSSSYSDFSVRHMVNDMYAIYFSYKVCPWLDPDDFISFHEQIGFIPVFILHSDYYNIDAPMGEVEIIDGELIRHQETASAAYLYKESEMREYDDLEDVVWSVEDNLSDDVDDNFYEDAMKVPAPSLEGVILEPDQMASLSSKGGDSWNDQLRRIAGLFLWDGWNPQVISFICRVRNGESESDLNDQFRACERNEGLFNKLLMP